MGHICGYGVWTQLFINGSCFFQLGSIISNICRGKNGERDLPSLCFKTSNVSQQSDSCEIIFDFFHNAYKDQPQEMVWKVPVLKMHPEVSYEFNLL